MYTYVFVKACTNLFSAFNIFIILYTRQYKVMQEAGDCSLEKVTQNDMLEIVQHDQPRTEEIRESWRPSCILDLMGKV